MNDVVILAVTLGFGLISWLLVEVADRLAGESRK
jgi:hypothetical protein